MNKIFLGGPISGLETEVAEQEFCRYEDALKALGYEVYNPIRELRKAGILNEPWHVILRFSLAEMMAHCKELHLLPGWQNSKGATIEHDLAKTLKIPIVYLKPDDGIIDRSQVV